MRHAFGVVHHRHRVAVELLIVRQGLFEYFLPFAEADQHVLLDSNEAFEQVGHRRRGDAQHRLRHGLDQLVGRGNGRRILPEEHRAIRNEMVVVDPVGRVEIQRPSALVVLAVSDGCFLVPQHHVLVVAALDVDVAGHVHEVAHVGGEFAQPVA